MEKQVTKYNVKRLNGSPPVESYRLSSILLHGYPTFMKWPLETPIVYYKWILFPLTYILLASTNGFCFHSKSNKTGLKYNSATEQSTLFSKILIGQITKYFLLGLREKKSAAYHYIIFYLITALFQMLMTIKTSKMRIIC